VPTERGDVWFKANSPELAHEAGIVDVVAARRPDCVPPLLAVDLEAGWMLMADGGKRLREVIEQERDLERWREVLPSMPASSSISRRTPRSFSAAAPPI
jgi:hypothetical protein